MIDKKAVARIAVAAWGIAAATGAGAQAPASAPSQIAPEASPQVDCKPRYPQAAVRAGAQGVTRLAFHVDATGKLTQVDIVGRSGPTREHQMLDKAAASALSLCPFKAATDANGHPIESVFTVNYTWLLQ